MDEHFLLKTPTAQKLYHEFAKDMPIFDYHCHLSAQEIAENKSFNNLSEIWLQGDHYKWRALRSNGVDERFITGDATDKEKFDKWAETVPDLLGNPLYHWTSLELKRFFHIQTPLNSDTADEIWNKGNELLQSKELTARSLIEKSNVKGICTTDDPLDDLQYHLAIKEDATFNVKVLPTFRPDGALTIESELFNSWINKLEELNKAKLGTFEELIAGLGKRIDYFHEVGCRLSDHGLDTSFYQEFNSNDLDAIYQKGRANDELTIEETIQFRTAVIIELGKMYAAKGWAMQLHIGALRNNNKRMLEQVGPNTGFDSIADFSYASDLSNLLNAMDYTNELPKTIIYNLNPGDNYTIGTMIGNFQGGTPGKIQFGTAWWFGDQRDGMVAQMKVLANCGILARFVGMVTDSRSFLSYTRHEYFRRILCDVVGDWVENGEYPEDFDLLGKIIQDICFHNVQNYLSIEL